MSDAATDGHVIFFGNPAVHEAIIEDGVVTGYERHEDLGAQVTEVHLPSVDADVLIAHVDDVAEALDANAQGFLLRLMSAHQLDDWEVGLKHISTVVSHHAAEGVTWVETDDETLREVLARFFKAKEGAPKSAELPPLGGGSPEWDRLSGLLDRVEPQEIRELAERELLNWPGILARLDDELTALKTSAGIDALFAAGFTTATQPAAFNYVALTANEAAPASGDTTLEGEINKAGGGLNRKQATFAHTTGTTTATLTVTFTANGSDALPATAHKFGIFNASSAGTLGIESTLTAVTWNASGDSAALTETLTYA